MKRHLLALLVLVSISVLSGCAVGEWLTRDVHKEEIQAAKDKADTVAAQADAAVTLLKAQLADAQRVARETNDVRAAQAVALLARALDASGTALAAAKDVSAKAQTALDALPAGGSPRWQVGLALAWPFALPLLLRIPVVGPILGMASPLIQSAINTPSRNAELVVQVARSKALTHQTAFANDILEHATTKAQAGETVAEIQAALDELQAIKDEHRHAQEAAGVVDVIRSEVVAASVKSA